MTKNLLKTMESNITLESRHQFYSQLEQRTCRYLEDIFGKEILSGLQKCELNNFEIDLINKDLISIMTHLQEANNENTQISLLKENLVNKTALLIRPELTICTEIVLEFLLKQKKIISSVEEINLTISQLNDVYSLKLSQNQNFINNLPTCFINFLHSPAKIIFLKEPLNDQDISLLNENIFSNEYELISNIWGNRTFSLLDPLKYVQNQYLGLTKEGNFDRTSSYLETVIKILKL